MYAQYKLRGDMATGLAVLDQAAQDTHRVISDRLAELESLEP
jgi:hypothetical protein